MKFHILTLFPEMVMQGLNTSIIGRAVEKELIAIEAVNIRDFTMDKHGKVDDYPYGGGAGMLMQAQPVYDAWRQVVFQSAVTNMKDEELEAFARKPEEHIGKPIRTIYVTPQGRPFTQKMAEDFAAEKELIFLCGHYEGIDERVLEETVTDYVSIGDYVLTGGELPAMVMIDAISRLVPGVLNNDVSAETESFHNDLLEYPQYSRPEEWHGKKVPQVLLSGNHGKITQWRLEQSKERTKERRPDLYAKYQKKEQVIKRLSKNKRNNIHIMENLSRGKGEILYEEGNNILVYDRSCKMCMLTVTSPEMGEKLLDYVPEDVQLFVTSQKYMNEPICERFGLVVHNHCYQSCYTQRETLPVKHKDIRLLDMDSLDYVIAHYSLEGEGYEEDRIRSKALYGAYVDDRLAGFVGIHSDGSTGLLYVEDEYRRQGLGESLLSFMINRQREWGYVPYGHIVVGNEKSLKLQEKLGLYCAKDTIWWLERK